MRRDLPQTVAPFERAIVGVGDHELMGFQEIEAIGGEKSGYDNASHRVQIDSLSRAAAL